jgi:diadenosine tetraphosphate (Ap4A) HIT family hydrolase
MIQLTSLMQAHVHVHGRWNGGSTMEPAPRINNRSPKVKIARNIPSIVNLVINSCQDIYLISTI